MPESKRAPRWTRFIVPGILTALVAILVVFVVSTAANTNDDPDPTEKCQAAVTDRLKAPSTADFVDNDIVDEKGDGEFRVIGDVDAQNSFGAMVRTTYTCVVRDDGDGILSLVSVTTN